MEDAKKKRRRMALSTKRFVQDIALFFFSSLRSPFAFCAFA
jgi:hypothetical protein